LKNNILINESDIIDNKELKKIINKLDTNIREKFESLYNKPIIKDYIIQ
jgi:hypothetical protein